MEFLELKNISERHLELINPTTPEKLLNAGRVAGMRDGSKVVDFGCGYGAALILWSEAFGVSGVGIDIRPHACERARARIEAVGLSERLQVVCGSADAYAFEQGAYDVAACIGATFAWEDGFQGALRAMREAVKPQGRLIVGEAHWLRSIVPPEFAQRGLSIKTEGELLEIARAEGCEMIYALHSSHDDWDRYEAENWRGLSDWLDENPDHPEWEEVLRHLRESQDEYLRYGREYFGWALYVLKIA